LHLVLTICPERHRRLRTILRQLPEETKEQKNFARFPRNN
jgi:hypothetical protein